jgi:hypothetical protein
MIAHAVQILVRDEKETVYNSKISMLECISVFQKLTVVIFFLLEQTSIPSFQTELEKRKNKIKMKKPCFLFDRRGHNIIVYCSPFPFVFELTVLHV